MKCRWGRTGLEQVGEDTTTQTLSRGGAPASLPLLTAAGQVSWEAALGTLAPVMLVQCSMLLFRRWPRWAPTVPLRGVGSITSHLRLPPGPGQAACPAPHRLAGTRPEARQAGLLCRCSTRPAYGAVGPRYGHRTDRSRGNHRQPAREHWGNLRGPSLILLGILEGRCLNPKKSCPRPWRSEDER